MRILYIQYANPAAYPPVLHSGAILAKAGCSVRMLGVFTGSTDELGPPDDTFHLERLPFRPPGLRQKFQFVWFVLLAVWTSLSWRPAWVYVSDPFAALPGLLLHWLRRDVVYHEHDSLAAAPRTWFEKAIQASRRQLTRRAALCVLPNLERIKLLTAESGRTKHIYCVWNCPAAHEVLPNEPNPDDERTLRLFYHGSIVPARLPLTLLDAVLEFAGAIVFDIVGYETIGNAGYVARLKRYAEAIGAHDYIRFLGAKPRRDSLASGRRCRVGVSLMPTSTADVNERHMVGASNKAFDYMACGLALLVPQSAEWVKHYVDSGFGISCVPEDTRSISSAIGWFYQNPEKTKAMGKRGQQQILQEWNYEKQFKPVADRMLCRPSRG